MGFETMISVWPRFVPERPLLRRAAQEGLADSHRRRHSRSMGCPTIARGQTSTPPTRMRPQWYWKTIRDNIMSKGFDSLWADETEPDLPPNGAYFHIGPATQYFNVYPLFHTGALYDGFRKDEPQEARADSLARRVSGRAAQRRDRLVVRHLSDVGYLPAADSDGTRLRGVGHRLLVERHRRLAVPSAGASSGASAAARSHRRARERGRLRRLSRAVHALVSVRHVPAHHARARQPANQRGVVVWQAGRADSGEVSAPALRADAVHLLARLPDMADRRAVHARAAARLSRTMPTLPICAMSTCSARRFWWRR